MPTIIYIFLLRAFAHGTTFDGVTAHRAALALPLCLGCSHGRSRFRVLVTTSRLRSTNCRAVVPDAVSLSPQADA